MTRLSVNLNKIALVRNTRPLDLPSVTRHAAIAVAHGAHGITVHPRPDGRHIRTADVHALKALLAAHPDIEFNIEGNPFHDIVPLVLAVRPHQFTLVPDDPAAATSDHGWDLARDGDRVAAVLRDVRAAGVRTSLFMDPEPAAMARARDVGADRIELYTEPYAAAHGTPAQAASLARYAAAADAAHAAGLGINAGHDLNLANLPDFLRHVAHVEEVSIGHALTADALEVGMGEAVRRYLAAIAAGHAQAAR
ncbi:MAG: pyridoxine 5'-phosphate synthase [Burkholderiales bacterium]|jgi:pyridoxine 5-phosphate synthase|nr:pyridoxine 5'-phosphate synthase [Burkholderiales bacterium]